MNNKKKIILLTSTLVLMVAVPSLPILTQAVEPAYGVDLAYNRRVVSTGSLDGNLNTFAVDANPGTRYAASNSDVAYFYVNLGSKEKVGKVVIDWEAAYASEYQIQMSLDAANWSTVATINKTSASVDTIVFPTWLETQYVKFQGVTRATQYGYSFYSFEVYGPESLALNSTVTEVSSSESTTALPKQNMVDNLASTRWASLQSEGDNQYVIFDLLTPKEFDFIKIRWEVSFARIFRIYGHAETGTTAPVRADAGWTYLTGSEVGLGEVDSLALSSLASSRYLKLELVQRETSENTKKTGRYPWLSTFSIFSFELFNWASIPSVPLGSVMEFSKNSPAWTAAANITLNPEGLLIAPHGYPTAADGQVTNLASIADGDIPGFESYATYNPAVVYDNDRQMFHMIFRTELPDNFAAYYGAKYELGHMSTLSYAYSTDGVHFTRGASNPIAWPTTGDEAGGGLEDPRMFKIENDVNRGGVTTFYITYTMYDNSVTREGIIWTQDFVSFHKVGRISPSYGGAIKSGTFITDPEGNAVKINDPRPGKKGQVYMIYMKDGAYTRIGFTTDVLSIGASDIIDVATGGFGSDDIEDYTSGNESCMALTNIYGPNDQDIYLMYGGGRLSDGNLQNQQPNVNGWFYALGVLKTTKSNPFELTNLRMDLDEPTMYPTDTNKIDYGLFDKCMFADSLIRHDNQWNFYYGAGDMYVGLATARADFGAAAATFSKVGSVLTANTLALNKKYGTDKADYDVEFVSELYDLTGTKVYETSTAYSVPHFTHLALGKYSKGQAVSVALDLTAVSGLPENYYVVSYLREATTHEVLNHVSNYLVVTAGVTHTA